MVIDAVVARQPISEAICPVDNCRHIQSTRRWHRDDEVDNIVDGDRGRVVAVRNSPNRLGCTDPKATGSRMLTFLRASMSPTVH